MVSGCDINRSGNEHPIPPEAALPWTPRSLRVKLAFTASTCGGVMRGNSEGSRSPRSRRRTHAVKAIDLFCGVGGLTRGLEKAGIDVTLGVDIDADCEYPYAINNSADFLLESVSELSASDLIDALAGARFTLLAGCAPCQPFSTYRQKLGPTDGRWRLLRHFGRLATELKPDLITMENAPARDVHNPETVRALG